MKSRFAIRQTLALTIALCSQVHAIADPGFPRLLGMNIGAKNYEVESYQQDLAKLDVVILGFYRGWDTSKRSMRSVVQALKRRNPNLLVGQYTILNEVDDRVQNTAMQDVQFKLNLENWWLKRADGARVQWTANYDAWDINFTDWTKPDSNGQRFPQWLAERDYRIFFKAVPEFDIWYFDNVFQRPRIDKADWDLDGHDEKGTDERVQVAFRRAMASHWEHAKGLAPNVLSMGNTDNNLADPEYTGRLQCAFLEGLMGHTWSIENWGGWTKMMDRYHSVFNHLVNPKLVGFNVSGTLDDYRFFRYAFTSALMDDGYFSFSDKKAGYGTVPWFDEYEAKLGQAIDPPQTSAWQDGVYRRRFEKGVALVNPTETSKKVRVGPGYQRIGGKQAPEVNTGMGADELTIAAKDGIVLVLKR